MNDRTPPHDIQAEACVLGSMIVDERCIPAVGDIIISSDFHRPAHATIYTALIAMVEDGRPVDLVTLREELTRRGELEQVGEIEYLSAIVEGVPSAANATYYAQVVRRHAAKRELIVLGSNLADAAFRPDTEPADLIEKLQADAHAVEQRLGRRADETALAEAVRQAMADAEEAAKKQGAVGLRTGLTDLDGVTGGFLPGELVIPGGRTGAGKSTLAYNMAAHVAEKGGSILIVSGEMPTRQMGKRFLQARAGVWGSKLRRGMMGAADWQAVNDAEAVMRGWHVYLIGSALTIPQVAVRARHLAGRWRKPVDLIVIDYIQIMRPHEGRTIREQVVAISRAAKQLAIDQHCVVIAISQLSRAAFAGGDGRRGADRPPSMHDLRESGTLEQDADFVLLLHAPDPQPPNARKDRSLEVWLRVAKGRETGDTPWPDPKQPDSDGIRLRWWPGLTLFGNWKQGGQP